MPWMVKRNLETKTANLDLDQNCLNFQNLEESQKVNEAKARAFTAQRFTMGERVDEDGDGFWFFKSLIRVLN